MSRHRLLEGLGVIVLASGAALLWFVARDPDYEFDFSAVKNQGDIDQLLGLAEELERASKWSPWDLCDGSEKNQTQWQENFGAALAEVIRNNPRAKTGTDLLRMLAKETDAETMSASSHVSGGVDAGMADRITTFNVMIELLAERLDENSLRHLRQLEFVEMARAIQVELEATLLERRQRNIRRMATEPDIAALLCRCGAPAFPDPYSGGRQMLRSWAGKKARAEDIWVASLCAACRDLQPIQRLRKALHRVSGVPFASTAETDDFDSAPIPLVLLYDESRRSIKPVTGTAPVSVIADFSLFFCTTDAAIPPNEATYNQSEGNTASSAVSIRPEVRFDTGIDLVRLKVYERRDRTIGHRWPPESGVVTPGQFESLLHRLGLPQAFSVHDVSVQLKGNDEAPEVVLDFGVYHPEIPDCRWQHQLILSRTDPNAAIRRLRDTVLLMANNRLAEELPKLKTLHGMPATIRPIAGEAGGYECRLIYPEIGPLTFGLGISPQGRLVLLGLPRGKERIQIAARVCAVDPNLKGLQHLIRIDSVVPPDNDNPTLRGTLRILAKAVDANEDVSGVDWLVGPQPNMVHVGLDGQDLRDLRGIRVRLRQIPKADSKDPQELAKHVAEYLYTKYPALRGTVELVSLDSTDCGLMLRLGLLIRDWPEVVLGPVLVDADNFGREVDRLLTPQQVKQAANEQWSRARTHVRYGHVLGRLWEWEDGRDEAKAVVKCSVPIDWLSETPDGQPTQLRWTEMQRHVGGKWKGFVETQDGDFKEFSRKNLCRSMESKLKLAALEDAIRVFIFNASGLKATVRVERDGFGHGVWLRLNPLAIQVSVGLKIPLVPAEVHAQKIFVDQKGIHFPEELAATYRRTFPTPNFNVSDPTFSVNWEARGLGIGCKITPLWPPLFSRIGFTGNSELSEAGTAESVSCLGLNLPVSKIRQDNLWLHFIYVEGEFKGKLKDQQLCAEATVRLLEQWDAAHGDLVADFDDKVVSGHLRADIADLPSGPHLDGRMTISAQEGLKIQGAYETAGVKVDGTLRYRTDTDPPLVTITGQAKLPYIGSVDVHGDSDLKFEDAKVWAQGDVAACQFVGLGQLRYEFYARSTGGYRLSFYWHAPAGEVGYSYTKTGYSIREIDSEAIARELEARYKATTAEGCPIRPANDAERRKIALLPAMPGPPPVKDSSLLDLLAADEKSKYLPVPNLRWKVKPDETLFRVYQAGKEEQPSADVIRLRLSDLEPINPRNKSCWFSVRQRRGGKGGILLAGDSKQKKLRLLDCSSRETVNHLSNLTAQFNKSRKQLEELAPFGDGPEATASRHAVRRYCRMMINERQPELPEPVGGGGFLLSYRLPADRPVRNFLFCWSKDDRLYEVGFTDGLVSEAEQTAPFFARLRQLRPERHAQLVFLDEEDAKRAAILLFASEKRDFQLKHIPLDSRGRTSGPKVVLSGRLPVAAAILMAEKFAKRLYASQRSVEHPHVAYFGDEGICAVSEKGFYLLRKDEQPSRIYFVSQAAFLQWDHPNQRFLPEQLATREQREICWKTWRRDLAEKTVLSWSEQKVQGQWGANPLGMMLSLADKSPGPPLKGTRDQP